MFAMFSYEKDKQKLNLAYLQKYIRIKVHYNKDMIHKYIIKNIR